MAEIQKPVKRSGLRLKFGMTFYGLLRQLLWLRMRKVFASVRRPEPLPFYCSSHKTPLLRKLKDVDRWMQYNKIVNLNLAVKRLNGIVLRPGEVLSYWKLIGKPSKRKGYVDGMVL